MKLLHATFLIGLLVAALPSHADDAVESGATFDGLKVSYDLSGEIDFYLANRTDEAFSFYCGVEHLMEGKWREVLVSVDEDSPPKAAKMHQVAARGRALVSWRPRGPSRVPAMAEPGMYRFVVSRVASGTRHEIKYRSPEFELR